MDGRNRPRQRTGSLRQYPDGGSRGNPFDHCEQRSHRASWLSEKACALPGGSLKSNRYREAVSAGRIPVGHMIMEFGTRGIAKIVEAADLDFVVFDMEHSGLEIERFFDLMAWSK